MSLLKLTLPQFDISVHRICDLEKSFSAGDAHNMIAASLMIGEYQFRISQRKQKFTQNFPRM